MHNLAIAHIDAMVKVTATARDNMYA